MKKLRRTFSEKLGRLSSSSEEKDMHTKSSSANNGLAEFANDLSSSVSESHLMRKCGCEKSHCDKNDNKMVGDKDRAEKEQCWSQSAESCKECQKVQTNFIHANSFTYNRGNLSSLTEEEAMEVFPENDDKKLVKMRSQSEGSAIRKTTLRRHSSPSYANDPKSPYGKMESYECLELLGEGSYATVYKGKIKNTEQLVALKKVVLNAEEGTPFTAIREVSLLKTLKHANIVTLYDIIHTNTTLTLVFEYMSTDLSLYMEKRGCSKGINPRNAVLFTYQLLRGLDYCHKRKVLHRDLKPQNLLISEIGELKLADFGLARAKSIPTNTYSNEVVTLWYRPPDVLLGSTNYTTSLDMWGVGCIFLEMLTGTPVCPGQTDACDQLGKIFEILGTPNPSTWPELPELSNYKEYYYSCFVKRRKSIQLCLLISMLSTLEYGEEFAYSLLQYEPTLRLSAEDAMRHPLFNIMPYEIHNLKDSESIFKVKLLKLLPEETHQNGLKLGSVK